MCPIAYMCQPSGLQPVQVWSDEDLLSCRPGGLSGEDTSGPAPGCVRDHPEARPRMEPEEEIQTHERGSHHHTTVHSRGEANPVRGISINCWVPYANLEKS